MIAQKNFKTLGRDFFGPGVYYGAPYAPVLPTAPRVYELAPSPSYAPAISSNTLLIGGAIVAGAIILAVAL